MHSEQARATLGEIRRNDVRMRASSRKEEGVDQVIFRTVAPQENVVQAPMRHQAGKLDGACGQANNGFGSVSCE
jgi:hypothetical protein